MIECKETGSGTLGYNEAITLSGCTTKVNGKAEAACNPKTVSQVKLNGEFKSTLEPITTFTFDEEECLVLPPRVEVTSTSAFGFEGASTAVELPITMSGTKTLFGANSAIVSISSTWKLTGKYSGKKFAYAGNFASLNTHWRIEGKTLAEQEAWEPYESTGNFTLTSTSGGNAVVIECKETGSGTLGYNETLNLSGCTTKVNGQASPECAPKTVTAIKLDGQFKGTETSITKFTFDEEECVALNPTVKVTSSSAFGFEGGPMAVELPITMTGTETLFGVNKATVTVSSTWKLTGKYLGNKFAYAGNFASLNTHWRIEGKTLAEQEAWEPYSSSGNFTLTSTSGGNAVVIECKETGSGTLGYNEAITLSGCTTKVNGKAEAACNPKTVSQVKLNGEFKSTLEPITTFTFDEEECLVLPPRVEVTSTSAFGFEGASTAVELPITMSGTKTLFGANSAIVSISSTWKLTGKYSGKKFAYAGNFASLNTHWQIEGKTLAELEAWEPYSSAGTFVLTSTSGGNAVTIECKESGSGTLGYQEFLNLSGCTTKINGEAEPACNPKTVTAIKLDGQFKGTEASLTTFTFDEEECLALNPTVKVTSSSAFGFEGGSTAVELPVTMTGTETLFGVNKATVTVSSTWKLTGKYLGNKFAYV